MKELDIMKKSVRNEVFETNSSSVHAIVVNKQNMAINNGSIVVVKPGDYGWEFEEYRTPSQKLNYLWTAIVDNKENLDSWKEYIREALNLSEGVTFIDESEDTLSGYVDHAEELKDFLKDMRKDPDLLNKFIFGDSYVITGNDNSESAMPGVPSILDERDLYIFWKNN